LSLKIVDTFCKITDRHESISLHRFRRGKHAQKNDELENSIVKTYAKSMCGFASCSGSYFKQKRGGFILLWNTL